MDIQKYIGWIMVLALDKNGLVTWRGFSVFTCIAGKGKYTRNDTLGTRVLMLYGLFINASTR
jgi:hypothetical protein